MSKQKQEFSKHVAIDKISIEPSGFELSADAEACEKIAERLGIEGISSLDANIKLLKNTKMKAICVSGQIEAQVTQACILSGELVDEQVSDKFESYYVANNEILEELEAQDPDLLYEDIEVLEEDFIDIGELATQYLSLFLNPYPKKQGVDVSKIEKGGVRLSSEEDMKEELRQARNPFQGLKSLKTD